MSNDFNIGYIHYEGSVKILEMLGNSNRLLIVCELIKNGVMTVSQLSATTKIEEYKVLQHLKKLTISKIVMSVRKGTKIYASVEEQKIIDIIFLLGLLHK
ncbi:MULTISPECIES: ArsR family transcriptional regulator [Bacillus cereus group]|uniref:ArsR family transcriptional regulator n=1 Tax=Bacillus cereus group TaxID=86661 RepID=UPI0011A14BE9|nr:ArsR family transcriptional regulator [Bacillus thuringiensis]MDR5046685.1 helix-turn-helix transcriptional regulator [Bacillus thuringiensis]MEB8860903.1 ArsR family transcriptional regulator [Bacillus cereus]MEB9423128.1 ArsR family transcriptional regulator [Bacillus cereus]MRC87191.1 ArsR family transcriptional regulator [Bacillus thuringiensis]